MSVRHPAVAGSFYPAQPDRLKQLIESSFTHKYGPGRLPSNIKTGRNIHSVVCPHAGLTYSGPAASHCYLELSEQEQPDTVVVLGPNHTGRGAPVSVMGEGTWRTPLGDVQLDSELASKLVSGSDIMAFDESAHIREHSIEVQLLFLQYIYDDFELVPICMRYQDLETSQEVGRVLFDLTENRNVLIIASSDLNHMESQETSNRKDRLVIDALLELDEVMVQDVVRSNRISACGFGPISVAIVAGKLAGVSSAQLLSYYTSGDILGEYDAVVGYAAAKLTR